eukprot:2609987-Alexandrium_andersonii.AAC.1
MSASLVGSEMCIRDRSLQDTSTNRRLIMGPAAGATFRHNHKHNHKHNHCLLYTSDAADDM